MGGGVFNNSFVRKNEAACDCSVKKGGLQQNLVNHSFRETKLVMRQQNDGHT